MAEEVVQVEMELAVRVLKAAWEGLEEEDGCM